MNPSFNTFPLFFFQFIPFIAHFLIHIHAHAPSLRLSGDQWCRLLWDPVFSAHRDVVSCARELCFSQQHSLMLSAQTNWHLDFTAFSAYISIPIEMSLVFHSRMHIFSVIWDKKNKNKNCIAHFTLFKYNLDKRFQISEIVIACQLPTYKIAQPKWPARERTLLMFKHWHSTLNLPPRNRFSSHSK